MADAVIAYRPAAIRTSTTPSVPGPTSSHGVALAGAPYPGALARPGASTTEGAPTVHGGAHDGADSPSLERVEKLLARLSALAGAADASLAKRERQ